MSLKEKAAQRRQRVFHKQLLTMSQQEKAARRRRHLFKSNVPTRKKPAAGAESFRNNVHNKKSSPPQAPFCRKPQVASACKGRVRGSRARVARPRLGRSGYCVDSGGENSRQFYFSFFKLLYRVREGETLAICYFWVPKLLYRFRAGGNSDPGGENYRTKHVFDFQAIASSWGGENSRHFSDFSMYISCSGGGNSRKFLFLVVQAIVSISGGWEQQGAPFKRCRWGFRWGSSRATTRPRDVFC